MGVHINAAVIGDGNMLMIGAHVGHDARVGNNCTFVNNALVAGHVVLGDGCILSGHTAVQQRVRVGRLAMLGGMAASTKDVPPFVLQQGYNCVTGLNIIGMRRAGIGRQTIDALRQAYRVLYKEGRTHQAALERIDAGTYGICAVCGEQIAEGRLEARPWTPYCIRHSAGPAGAAGTPARTSA